jgi:hypothetical protein
VSVMIGRGEWIIGNDLAFPIKTYRVDWCGERLWLCMMLMHAFRFVEYTHDERFSIQQLLQVQIQGNCEG